MIPETCWARDDVAASSATIASRRSTRTASQVIGVEDQRVHLVAAPDRMSVTSAVFLSRSAIVSLRLLRDLRQPGQAVERGPNCGAIWSMVLASTSRDWFSDWVSVAATLVVRSLTASVSEYGDAVRDTGMTVQGRHLSRPRRVQRQHPFAEQCSGTDVGGGLRAEADLAVDGECHQCLTVVRARRR